MPLSFDDNRFQVYADHVLKFEGKTTADPKDSASKCIPGKIHTNRGVTYCTFKDRALALGITPVTHDRFVKMTDADAKKFLYDRYISRGYNTLPTAAAIVMTEADWGSGAHAWTNAIDTLNKLKVKGVPAKKATPSYTINERNKILELIKKVPESDFFDEFTKIRYQWLERLGNTPYGRRFKAGWLRRQNSLIALRNDIISNLSGNFFFRLLFIR